MRGYKTVEKKKLFIDLGAHRGQFCGAVKALLPDFRIIAFEPNPDCISELKKTPFIKLYQCAAWTENTKIPLYIDRKGKGKGTTVMPNKISGKVDYEHPVYVKAIDFSEFIQENREHTLFVKMNIEGAEFPILKKMVEDDTLKYIDCLIYAGHSKKVQFDGRDIELEVQKQVSVIQKNLNTKTLILKAKEYLY